MPHRESRRTFLQNSAAAGVALGLAGTGFANSWTANAHPVDACLQHLLTGLIPVCGRVETVTRAVPFVAPASQNLDVVRGILMDAIRTVG
jgi:hypothetical protein